MLNTILLPWWGWLYLFVVLTLFTVGFFLRDSADMDRNVGSALSLFSICVFVVGFFNHAPCAVSGPVSGSHDRHGDVTVSLQNLCARPARAQAEPCRFP